MQQIVRRGRRQFAVPQKLSLTDRIAATTNLRGNWQAILSHHKTGRVILNYHRR